MKNDLVSVVVPIYNVEKYLNKCVDTIINQTYKNLEIILVDDGSTDNSGKIADEYQKKDKRIFVIHKENGGLSDARNVGMEKATGKYICFIDSDDHVERSMIEQALNEKKSQNADVVVWGFYIDYENEKGNLTNSKRFILKKYIVDTSNDVKNLKVDMEYINILGYAWNKLYNLNFLKTNNFWFEKGLSKIEDLEFNCRVFQKVKKFVIMDKAFNHYIQRNRETLGNKKYDNLLEMNVRSCNSHKSLLQSWNIDKEKIQEIEMKEYLLISKVHIKDIVLAKELNRKDKIKKIDKLFETKGIKTAFENINFYSKKERIYVFLVKSHFLFILKMYYKILNR